MARALPDGDPLSESTGPRFSWIATGLRPGLCALRAHDGPALRSDLMAGLTVAAFLVPQVLAYAGVAGLPAVTGLWAALAALGCYALLGSSRQLSLGPESTTALLTASTVPDLRAAGWPPGSAPNASFRLSRPPWPRSATSRLELPPSSP